MRPHSLTSGATTRMRMIPSTPRPSRSNNEKKRRRKNATERLPLQPLNVSEKLPRNVTEKPRPSKLQLLQNQRVRQTGESLCATWRLAHPGPTPCLPLPTDAHTHTHTHTRGDDQRGSLFCSTIVCFRAATTIASVVTSQPLMNAAFDGDGSGGGTSSGPPEGVRRRLALPAGFRGSVKPPIFIDNPIEAEVGQDSPFGNSMVTQHTVKRKTIGCLCCSKPFAVPDEYAVARGPAEDLSDVLATGTYPHTNCHIHMVDVRIVFTCMAHLHINERVSSCAALRHCLLAQVAHTCSTTEPNLSKVPLPAYALAPKRRMP